jgi:hypothetical protein
VDSVLGRFGTTAGEAHSRYRAHAEVGIAEGVPEEFRSGGLVRGVGGWEALLADPHDRRIKMFLIHRALSPG